MAKQKAYLHVGLPHTQADAVDAAVPAFRHQLAELDVRAPAKSREEVFRAALEIRRQHREWGYRRSEVEGAWAGICRRALKGSHPVLVSQSHLAGATPTEIELLTSQLLGTKLHVVVTVAAPDGWVEPGDPDHDLLGVLERWSAAVKDPSRVHVVVAPRTDARRAVWGEIGRVVGFGTASLDIDALHDARTVELATPPPRLLDRAAHERLVERADSWTSALRAGGYDVRGDLADLAPAPLPASSAAPDAEDRLLRTTAALEDARLELERLARRNETLEARIAELAETRRPRLRRHPAA